MKWYQILRELPQIILGWIIFCFLSVKDYSHYVDRIVITFYRDNWFSKIFSGTSLGRYILLPENNNHDIVVRHEYGHCLQSKKLGWLYLLVIGIPSIINNLWDRTMHKQWDYAKRIKWYYGRYPEKQADILGGVAR